MGKNADTFPELWQGGSTAQAGKTLITILVGLLVLLTLLVALAPTLMSTAMGRGLLVGAINDSLRGSVAIDDLSLNWLSGQQIRGAALFDPDGKPVVRLAEFSTELTLLQAVRQQLTLGKTVVRGITANVIVDESGDSNLSRALASPGPEAESTALVIPITGNITLDDSRVSVAAPGVEPVVFDELTGMLVLGRGDQPLRVGLKGRSRQGDSAGVFTISGEVAKLIAADGALTPQTAQGKLDVDVQEFPVDGLDRLLGLRGVLSAGLGQRANLVVRAAGTATAQDLAITTRTPNLQLGLKGRMDQTQFELAEPATARLQVTPALYDAIAGPVKGEATLRLAQSFPVNLTVERLSIPMKDLNPGEVALRVGVDVQKPVQLSGAAELGAISIRDLKLVVDSNKLADKINVLLDGTAVSQDKPGNLFVRGELAQLFDPKGEVRLDKLRADVTAKLSNVPTALVDQATGQSGLLIDLLGPKLGLDAAVKSTGSEQIDATLAIDAGPLQTKGIELSVKDAISLRKSAQIRYALSPGTARRLLGKDAGLTLRQPAALALSIDAFTAPRPTAGQPLLQPDKTRVTASFSADPVKLSGPPAVGQFNIDGLRVDLAANPLSALQLRGAMQIADDQGSKKKFFSDINASPLRIQVDATGGLDKSGKPGPIGASLKLASAGLTSHTKLRVEPDFSRATLTAPASMKIVLTPALLTAVDAVAAGQPNLAKPAAVEVKLTQLDLPLVDFSFAGVTAKGTAGINELALAGQDGKAGAALRDVTLALDFDGVGSAASVKLDAHTALPAQQQAGSLSVDANLKRLLHNGQLDMARADINANARIKGLPTALIEAASGAAGTAALLGDTINVDTKVTATGGAKRSGALDIKAQSRNLDLDAGFKLGKELVLDREARARLTLTPQAYTALTRMPATPTKKTSDAKSGYELAKNATLDAVISTLRWPLDGAEKKSAFDPARAGITANVTAGQLALRDRATGQTVTIQGLQTQISGPSLAKPVKIDLSGQVHGAQEGARPTGPAGNMKVSTQLADVFTADGGFNADGLSVTAEGQLQRLPVALLDQLLAFDGLVIATLGPAADLTFDTKLKRMLGPLDLQLRSDNAKADINADLRKEGLVLRKPLVAEVEATQSFGKVVLGKIHPIFETLQSSEQPVRFEVPPQGVLIPTKNFNIKKVAIPQMKLDPGKLTLKSGWLLKGLVGLAQQFGVYSTSGRDQWTAWFTPAVLQMAGGKVVYSRRMDLLLDERLHLATWGSADIADDRADLVLAFMSDTLTNVFRLPTAPGDALRIPVRGPLGKPSVDFTKAAVELGRLRAQKSLVKKDPLTGALLGTVTRSATGGGGPIPAASMDPLPWGTLAAPEVQPQTQQPSQAQQPPATKPKSLEEQAVEGLFDLLRKKK